MSEQPKKHKTLQALGMVRRNLPPSKGISPRSTDAHKNPRVETVKAVGSSISKQTEISSIPTKQVQNREKPFLGMVHEGAGVANFSRFNRSSVQLFVSLFVASLLAMVGAIATVEVWKIWREEAHIAQRMKSWPRNLVTLMAQAEPSTVHLSFASQPAQAQVLTDQNKYICKTPCEVRIPRSLQRQEYRFLLQGFAEQMHGIVPDRDQEIYVNWPRNAQNKVHSVIEEQNNKSKVTLHGAKREESSKAKTLSSGKKVQPWVHQETNPQAPSTNSESQKSTTSPPFGELMDPFARN